MKLGRASRAALAYLHKHGEADAGSIGAHLWRDRKGRGISASGGGDYAAQMLLGRLRKAGLVTTSSGEGATRWTLTPSGRALATPIDELIAKSSIGKALADVKERGIDAHLADLERGRFK